ncbi:MAG: TIGR02808 family protein [Colwellia sp.]|nr:TIGR02808 family protein [Colwellia sp.]NQY89597.1 TIGR02808 family protein [Colwellia sp.]
MSELEQLIWNVLGYMSMPVIFITGFVGTALIAVAVLKMMGVKAAKPE